MIYRATELIKEEMDQKGMKYSIREYADSSVLSASFGIENGPRVNVKFISRGDRDVALRLFSIVHHVTEDKTGEMLKAINKCNSKYRYLKFTLDEDQDVNIEYDFPLDIDDASFGKAVCGMLVLIVRIVNEAYPELMQAFWEPQAEGIHLPEDSKTH